jgi:hypothetical protein
MRFAGCKCFPQSVARGNVHAPIRSEARQCLAPLSWRTANRTSDFERVEVSVPESEEPTCLFFTGSRLSGRPSSQA